MNVGSKLAPVVGMAIVLTACATVEPSINTGPDAFVSPDGLYRVDNSRMDVVLVKPDLDLGQYDSIKLAPVTIAYKRGSYELTDRQQEEMLETFNEVMADVLGDGHYTLATETGDNVLLANVKLVDLFVNVPTEGPFSAGARTRMFTASSGEISLIGELRDSKSGELLVQFADRNQPRNYWARSTEITEWAEVRSAFRFWANILKDRLDYFHATQIAENG